MIDQLGILVHAISSRLTPRRTQEAWIADVQPLFRQYRAVALLSVSAFSATADNLDIGAVAEGLLRHNRFELTRASELIHLPGAPLRTIPGYALARIHDRYQQLEESGLASAMYRNPEDENHKGARSIKLLKSLDYILAIPRLCGIILTEARAADATNQDGKLAGRASRSG
jgi:hypothetical protein